MIYRHLRFGTGIAIIAAPLAFALSFGYTLAYRSQFGAQAIPHATRLWVIICFGVLTSLFSGVSLIRSTR